MAQYAQMMMVRRLLLSGTQASFRTIQCVRQHIAIRAAPTARRNSMTLLSTPMSGITSPGDPSTKTSEQSFEICSPPTSLAHARPMDGPNG